MAFTLDMLIAYRLSLFALRRGRRDSNSGGCRFRANHGQFGSYSVSRVGPGRNDIGASRGHIMDAVEASLRRLQTDYIDLYQIHGNDSVTPVGETLRALDTLVQQGKVRYIGCSNWQAWKIAKALGISEYRNLLHRWHHRGAGKPGRGGQAVSGKDGGRLLRFPGAILFRDKWSQPRFGRAFAEQDGGATGASVPNLVSARTWCTGIALRKQHPQR
jgi:hypothetical protein